MTAPTPPVFLPVWLAPSDVRDWLRMNGADPIDDAQVTRVCAAVEPQVQAARPDQWTAGDPAADPPELPVYAPDAEVYHAGVMLAAREVRRRNSPGGLETFAESITYVSAWDPEIQRALRQGQWRHARVG